MRRILRIRYLPNPQLPKARSSNSLSRNPFLSHLPPHPLPRERPPLCLVLLASIPKPSPLPRPHPSDQLQRSRQRRRRQRQDCGQITRSSTTPRDISMARSSLQLLVQRSQREKPFARRSTSLEKVPSSGRVNPVHFPLDTGLRQCSTDMECPRYRNGGLSICRRTTVTFSSRVSTPDSGSFGYANFRENLQCMNRRPSSLCQSLFPTDLTSDPARLLCKSTNCSDADDLLHVDGENAMLLWRARRC